MELGEDQKHLASSNQRLSEVMHRSVLSLRRRNRSVWLVLQLRRRRQRLGQIEVEADQQEEEAMLWEDLLQVEEVEVAQEFLELCQSL